MSKHFEVNFGTRRAVASIAEIVRDANDFDTRRWLKNQMPMMNTALLPDDAKSFLRLLEREQIDYCLVGGIALLAYVEERNTKDIDVIIGVGDLELVRPFLTVLDEDKFFLNAKFNELRVDFLKTTRDVFAVVKRDFANPKTFDEGVFPTATPEGIIILKFDALYDLYRRADFNKAARYEWDIRALAQNYQIDWERIWATLAAFFGASEIAEFQKIADELRRQRGNPFQ